MRKHGYLLIFPSFRVVWHICASMRCSTMKRSKHTQPWTPHALQGKSSWPCCSSKDLLMIFFPITKHVFLSCDMVHAHTGNIMCRYIPHIVISWGCQCGICTKRVCQNVNIIFFDILIKAAPCNQSICMRLDGRAQILHVRTYSQSSNSFNGEAHLLMRI
jgi:hypothetical protein